MIFFKNLKMNYYLVFTGLGLLISLGVCSLMYLQFRNHNKELYLGTLASVATMIEKEYPILHDVEKLKHGFEKDEDWFWETSQSLNNIATSFDVAYIYYIEKVKTGYVFCMSSIVSRTNHPEWLGGPVWTETDTPPGVDEAYNTQMMTFSPRPSVEEWGTLVSAYLPIVTNGETVGLLGVDYEISYVNALQRHVLIFLIFSFAASAVLTGLLAFFGSQSVLIPIKEQKRIATEANERNRKIEYLMKNLKDAMNSKSVFMARISDEMANPVQTIINSTSLMMRNKQITEEQRKSLNVINDSGMILYNAINDILEINKLESGTMGVHHSTYELPKLINDVISNYTLLKEDKPIRFMVSIDEKLPLKLFGDDNHIKQICSKLLSNAFRFTSKGTISFRVSFKQKDESVWLIIKVSDAGIGIAKKELDILLSDYGQINVAQKLSSGGTTGLGLYIIRKTAEMMKGKLTVESEVGKGSSFTFYVPQKMVSNETIGPVIAKQLNSLQYIGDMDDHAIAG